MGFFDGFVSSYWLDLVLSQVATTMFVLFYFLRDGETILKTLRSIVPLSTTETDLLFTRITQMIKVSLGGKLVVAAIQGTLGGLMFGWLGLGAYIVVGYREVAIVIGGGIASCCQTWKTLKAQRMLTVTIFAGLPSNVRKTSTSPRPASERGSGPTFTTSSPW